MIKKHLEINCSTGYISDNPTRKELEKKNVKQLFGLVIGKQGLKQILIKFILDNGILKN